VVVSTGSNAASKSNTPIATTVALIISQATEDRPTPLVWPWVKVALGKRSAKKTPARGWRFTKTHSALFKQPLSGN